MNAMNRRDFLQTITASTLTSMWFLGGCWNPLERWLEPEEDAPIYQEKGLLRFAFSAPPKTFDPALASSSTEYNINFLTHDGLVWVDKHLEAQPDLAESWEYSQDLLEWTFFLRQNAVFNHDDLPVIADDVVYSLN